MWPSLLAEYRQNGAHAARFRARGEQPEVAHAMAIAIGDLLSKRLNEVRGAVVGQDLALETMIVRSEDNLVLTDSVETVLSKRRTAKIPG